MIIDAFLNMFGSVLFVVMDLIPAPGWPSWLVDDGPGTVDGALTFFSDNLGPMAGFVNFSVLFSALTVLVGIQFTLSTTRTLIAWIGVVKP